MATRMAILTEKNGTIGIHELDMPKIGPKNTLIKTTRVAFNPFDQVSVDFYSPSGCIVGCDFAGVVEEVGDAVEQDLKPGDRVCGFAHGGRADSMEVLSQLFSSNSQETSLSHEHGAFATYTLGTGDLCIKIPPNLSDEDAVTLPVGLIAAATALYWYLKFPLPGSPLQKKVPIFIYGGSSSTGCYAIQLAKLSGLQVITTASPHNFDYVKSLGADLVFDYRSPTLVQDVRRNCPMISNIIDAVSRDDLGTPALCAKIMCLAGGTYISTLPVKCPRADVRTEVLTSLGAFGEKFSLGPHEIPPMPEYHMWAKQWYAQASRLVSEGKLKPFRHKLLPDGFEGVIRYLKEHRQGARLSGYKAVFEVP